VRNQFNVIDTGDGLFDVSSDRDLFVLETQGKSTFEFAGLMASGLNERDLRRLDVSGSIVGGGEIGRVTYSFTADTNPEEPTDNSRPFVDIAGANATLTYDTATGDIEISAINVAMTSIELTSLSGLFVGTQANDYTVDLFDSAEPNRYFRLAPSGLESVTLKGIAATGLTAETLASDLTHDGSVWLDVGTNSNQGVLHLSLIVIDSQAAGPIPDCQIHQDDGQIVGDANLDGRFDSSDLVLVFQAGEYDDDIAKNSNWSDGDWNCDGDFNSGDLVVAFQLGHYESALAANIHDRSINNRRDEVFAYW
jgi:hypothetical protein